MTMAIKNELENGNDQLSQILSKMYDDGRSSLQAKYPGDIPKRQKIYDIKNSSKKKR